MSSFNINRVVIVGRLTRDPELRSLASGQSVCSLRLACSSSQKDGDGEYSERPNYFDVSVFGVTAQNVGNYTAKGSQVAIDGRLSWREWEAEDDSKRQAVSIVADRVQFLDRAGEHDGAGASDDAGLDLAGVGGDGPAF
ncbi:MAG TPA: single-stranded DNA-binding protein [Solirubrobacteraceae bacterium]|jgi:single-strand DNA-binding protein